MTVIYKRKCFTCGKRIDYYGFHLTFCFAQKNDEIADMVQEIWENPIFVLQCCTCFHKPSYTKEFFKICENIKQHRKRLM